MTGKPIPEWQALVGHVNTANGWREKPPVPGAEVDRAIALLALIGTEVSEAIEELRDGRAVTERYYRQDGKPEGVPAELADVVIRCLDFADLYGIDLEDAMAEKTAHNVTRGHRHGGKAL